MPVTLGRNISSIQGQRRLAETDLRVGRILERLASGQRINRASDDAAGLAIASDLNVGRRVFSQGIRNINDGLSLLSIADSAIGELTGIVTRIRELTQQAANGSFSNQQRKALDIEAQQLAKEYTRIAQTTSYNNLSLLNGSLGEGVRFQVGFGTDGSLSSSIGGSIGTGTFESAVMPAGMNVVRVARLTDLNGDGVLDLVGGDDFGRVVSSLGRGDGTFGPVMSHGNVSDPVLALSLGDVNGDGIQDALSVGQFGSMQLFLGKGDGTFSAPSVAGQLGQGTAIELSDVNGDGHLDIIGTSRPNNEVRVFLGAGDGTFSAAPSISTTNPYRLAMGDVNGDGVPDILSAGTAGISVFTGNGDGTFSEGVILAGAAGYLAVGDINRDGKLDVVSARADQTLAVFLGNGDGSFTSAGSFSTGTGSSQVTLGDFNGDGNLDAAVANTSAGTISVLFGAGDGSFSSTTPISGSTGVFSLAVGDIDRDGVVDIVSASNASAGVQVYLGESKDGVGSLDPFSLATRAEALQALAPITRRLELLSEQRGTIGAFQSRLSSALNTLLGKTENYASAEGRIRDADVAAESASLARVNILRSASASVLAQANLQPQLVLLLLGSKEPQSK